MAMMTGVVEALSNKTVTTKFGPKPTFSFLVDGEWYKTGFGKPPCAKGDTITFSYTKGTYGKEVDVKSITKEGAGSAPSGAVAAAPKSAPYSGGKGVFPIPALDGQRAIVRQNSLTNARELFVASKGGDAFEIDTDTLLQIVSFAQAFESYACGDLDAKKALTPVGNGKAKASMKEMADGIMGGGVDE